MEMINLVKLLKDCPKGMELDCTMFYNVKLDCVDEDDSYPIKITAKHGFSTRLNKYGQSVNIDGAKCVIFPKGKTTWEGFVPPCKFEDGDVLVHTQNQRFVMSIYHKRTTRLIITTHCILWDKDEGLSINQEIWCYPDKTRFATEEEKAKLFQAIKDNGYRWNTETKTLEKLVGPQFHEGDWVVNRFGDVWHIDSFDSKNYQVSNEKGNYNYFPISKQDEMHIWTINDAKDGDVLAAHECLVLFKKIDGLNIKCYCTYHFMGHQSFYVDTLQNKDAFHPATKEQRDLLFQKIQETINGLLKPRL